MLHIWQKYVFIITIMAWLLWKNSRISAKMHKTEGPGKKKIASIKLIKIQSCHMGVIFMPKHMTWQRQQCVHTHSQIMRYHTGNVYLRCCVQCPIINIPDQEIDDKHPNPSPSIHFHIYHLIAHCKKYGWLPLTDKKMSQV